MIRLQFGVLILGLGMTLVFSPDSRAGQPPAGVTRVTIFHHGGQEGRDRLVVPGEWLPYSCGLAAPYQGGKVLRYHREGPAMWVSIDGRPREICWVNVAQKGGVDTLREALKRGAGGFTVRCASEKLGELPLLPANRDIALFTSPLTDPTLLERQEGITGLMTFARSREELEALAAFPDLTSLRLFCKEPCDLTPVTRLRKLVWLRVYGVIDIEPLVSMPSLRGLCVRVGDKPAALRPISQLSNLVALDLSYSRQIVDIAPLASLTRIEKLSLQSTSVADLAPLAHMPRLQYLDLYDCDKIERLDGLTQLEALTDLELSKCAGVTDLSPLAELMQLRRLGVRGCPVADEGVNKLEKALPKCRIER